MNCKTIDYPTIPTYNGKLDKRTKQGKEWYKQNMVQSKKSFVTNDTITTYILKIRIINMTLGYPNFSEQCTEELKNLFTNSKVKNKIILKELKFLKNIPQTVQELRKHYQNDNSFKYFIAILASICSRIKSLHDHHQALAIIYRNINKEYINQRGNNQGINMINYHDQDDKVNKFNSIANITDKLIFGLYMFMFPRRVKDIVLLKFVRTIPDDTNYNYLVINDNGTMTVCYNNYKTSSTYGTQSFDIPPILYDCILEYLENKNIFEGMFIFKQDHNDAYISVPNMSKRIKNLMMKLYNVPCTNRNIRRSAVSGIDNMSVNQRREIASAMGHSINEQLMYANVQ